MFGRLHEQFQFIICKRTFHLGGKTNNQALWRDYLIFSNKRTSSDNAIVAYLHAIHDCCAHTYQATVADIASVDYRAVANSYIIAYCNGMTNSSMYNG